MKSTNHITLCGRVGSSYKDGRSKSGNDYIAFAMEIETRTEFRSVVHILCFNKDVIDYLRRLKVHEGTPIIVFGGVSSWASEIKGQRIIQNGVFAERIYVIKT